MTGGRRKARQEPPGDSERARIERRFWRGKFRKSKKPDACWIWKAACRSDTGYGRFHWNQAEGTIDAHVASYRLEVGAISADHEVDHLCGNPPCVRPEHLEPVTGEEHEERTTARRAARRQDAAGTASAATSEDAFDPWSGVLKWKEKAHRHLVVNLDDVAHRAGIPKGAICRGLENYVDQAEIDWMSECLSGLNSDIGGPPSAGLLYVCDDIGAVVSRMVGLCGCFVRNSVEARFMPIREVVRELLPPDPARRPRVPLQEFKVLLIPDLFAPGTERLVAQHAAQLAALLRSRWISKQQVVTCAVSLDIVKARLGEEVRDLIDRQYEVLEQVERSASRQ